MKLIPPKIPKGWSNTTLGEVSQEMHSGGTPSTKNSDYWQGEIPWITSKWLNDKLYLISGEKAISETAIKRSASRIVPAGSLIFATRVGVGKVAVNTIDIAINQDLAGILVNRSIVLPEFLAYQLKSNRVQQFVEQNKRGATIKGITKTCLKEIRILLPPWPEQRRIAAILSTVQRAIEQQERLIALTTELKKALMQKLFTEGTRGEPQKQTEIGSVPGNWEVVRLGDLLKMSQYGLSVKGSDAGNCAMLRMTNQINGQIVANDLQLVHISEDEFIKFKVDPGDILFNRTNSFDLVGRTAIFDIDGNFVFASYLIRLKVDDKQLNPFFLNHYLNWGITQQRLKSIATRAVSQSNISATRLKGFYVPLPPLDSQKEIVEDLNLIDSKIPIHEKRRNRLNDLFRTLLHQLMTAQIRVNDVDLSELALEIEDETPQGDRHGKKAGALS